MSQVNTYSLLLSDAVRIRTAAGPRFSGMASIARFLDSSTGSPGGTISEILASGSARNLSQAIDQLNPTERNALRTRWGRSLEELISLSNERDARVFQHGLLQLGRRLEDNDQVDLAGVVYSALVAEGSNSPHPPLNLRGGEERREGGEMVPPLRLRGGQEGLLPSDVTNQAQRRLNAINGVGDWRERFAFSLQRIPNQATRWDVLLAMTGAGFTFRGFRLLTTASWAGSFESALALNAASTSAAFLAETIAFTSLGKVAGALAGHPQDTSANGIFNEWAGGAAMLLGLKGMGALTGAGVRSIYGEASAVGARHAVPLRRFTEIFAPQAGMFMGILVGNRLAELGGFYPERHGDTWMIDGITTLIEFNVAGRIQRVAGGPALTSLEARMEAITRNIGHGSGRPGEIWDGRSKDRPLPGVLEWMSESFRPELVTPEGIRLPPFENRKSTIENRPNVFSISRASSSSSDASKTQTEILSRRLAWRLSQGFPGETEATQEIVTHFSKTPFPHLEAYSRERYAEFLGRLSSESRGSRLLASDLVKAAEVFSRAMRMNSFREATGSHYEYLLQVALERCLESDHWRAFADLVQVAARPLAESLEPFFVRHGWQGEYQMPEPPWYRSWWWAWKGRRLDLKSLAALPVESRQRLRAAWLHFEFGADSAGFRDPEKNYLRFQDAERLPAWRALALQNLALVSEPAALDRVIARAVASPVPLLYFDRLLKILATRDLSEKIRELGETERFDPLALREVFRASQNEPDYDSVAAWLDGSLYVGFVRDPVLARKFARLYDEAPLLSFEPERKKYQNQFYQLAQRLLSEKQTALGKAVVNYGREEVLKALEHRPTPLATQALQAVLAEKLDLEVFSEPEMRQLWLSLKPGPRDLEPPQGLILAADKRPLLRDGSRPTRPLIAIKELDPGFSLEAKASHFVELPAVLVHEFEHYLHRHELSFKTVRGLLKAEMRAWVEEVHYRLYQGVAEEWDTAAYSHPFGFGVYLRNLIDQAYFQGRKDLFAAREAGAREGT